MTIQNFFCRRTVPQLLGLLSILGAGRLGAEPPVNDYPTVARVEYVNECIAANGGTLTALYRCSCALDRIAARMSYDDFVEAGTYARYATLPGEGGGIFRDSAKAKDLGKRYRELEGEAHRACGLAE
jgi:hypothetical protein